MRLTLVSAAIFTLGLAASSADAAMVLRPQLTMQVRTAHDLVGQKVTLLKTKSLSRLSRLHRASYRKTKR